MSDNDSNSNSDGSEDARMKELLASWEDDKSEDSSDSSDEEEEEEVKAGATKFDLNLQDSVLDHIVLAAPDLQEAMKEFENMTGIKPAVVGSLRGLGTKSARVGLDNNAYIEIIAPDPKNAGPIGAAPAADLEEGTLVPYHFAVRSSEIAEMKDEYVPNELGWQPDHITMFGAGADGTPKKWEMLFMYGHQAGGVVPFYIDWGQCDHPTASIPEVGALKNLTVQAPSGHKVHDLLSSVDGINVEEGEPYLEFSFGSPEGTITFSADSPTGIKFPGFEEEDMGPAVKGPPGKPELLPIEGAEESEDDGALVTTTQDKDDDDSSAAGSVPGDDDDASVASAASSVVSKGSVASAESVESAVSSVAISVASDSS